MGAIEDTERSPGGTSYLSERITKLACAYGCEVHDLLKAGRTDNALAGRSHLVKDLLSRGWTLDVIERKAGIPEALARVAAGIQAPPSVRPPRSTSPPPPRLLNAERIDAPLRTQYLPKREAVLAASSHGAGLRVVKEGPAPARYIAPEQPEVRRVAPPPPPPLPKPSASPRHAPRTPVMTHEGVRPARPGEQPHGTVAPVPTPALTLPPVPLGPTNAQRIEELLVKTAQAMTVADIAETLGVAFGTTASTLSKMDAKSVVRRVGPSRYALADVVGLDVAVHDPPPALAPNSSEFVEVDDEAADLPAASQRVHAEEHQAQRPVAREEKPVLHLIPEILAASGKPMAAREIKDALNGRATLIVVYANMSSLVRRGIVERVGQGYYRVRQAVAPSSGYPVAERRADGTTTLVANVQPGRVEYLVDKDSLSGSTVAGCEAIADRPTPPVLAAPRVLLTPPPAIQAIINEGMKAELTLSAGELATNGNRVAKEMLANQWTWNAAAPTPTDALGWRLFRHDATVFFAKARVDWQGAREFPEFMGLFEELDALGEYRPGGRAAAGGAR